MGKEEEEKWEGQGEELEEEGEKEEEESVNQPQPELFPELASSDEDDEDGSDWIVDSLDDYGEVEKAFCNVEVRFPIHIPIPPTCTYKLHFDLTGHYRTGESVERWTKHCPPRGQWPCVCGAVDGRAHSRHGLHTHRLWSAALGVCGCLFPPPILLRPPPPHPCK